MKAQSSKKDIIYISVICLLCLATALNWTSKNSVNRVLTIERSNLRNCQEELQREKESNKQLKENYKKALDTAKESQPILDQHIAMMELFYKGIKNKEVSSSLIREYEQILKK